MIKLLTPADCQRWDNYVMASEEASFFHLSAWQQVIQQAFDHQTYYYFYEQDGEIAGILPLVHIKSLLFGNALI